MLYGFDTQDELKAKAALIVYAIYKSRAKGKGPSGLDMWGQIERFAKSAAKRATGVDEFVAAFKRKMGCSTINPYWLRGEFSAVNAVMNSDGTITMLGEGSTQGQREFGLKVFEPEDPGESEEIVSCLYNKTQIIILLVRDRLEREKPFENMNMEESENED